LCTQGPSRVNSEVKNREKREKALRELKQDQIALSILTEADWVPLGTGPTSLRKLTGLLD